MIVHLQVNHVCLQVQGCVSHFSVGALKGHSQKQLKEEFILAYSSSHAWQQEQTTGGSYFIYTQEAEREKRCLEAFNPQGSPPLINFLQPGSTS